MLSARHGGQLCNQLLQDEVDGPEVAPVCQ